MRFSRDKRGYENTFVVHGDRRRGKGRSRLLYWFRTPPGVKVGRAALDEEAVRLIEELNPEIAFDWTRILKGDERPDDGRMDRRGEDRRSRGGPRQSSGTVSRHRRETPAWPVSRDVPSAGHTSREPDIPAEIVPSSTDAPLAADDDDAGRGEAQPDVEFVAPPVTAAHARLGGEGVARLRGRYAEILARISERVANESRRQELKALAERLNPDTWITDEEVKSGLEEYEGVFESLRAVIGRRKRRRRRGGRPASGGDPLSRGEPESAAGGQENEPQDL